MPEKITKITPAVIDIDKLSDTLDGKFGTEDIKERLAAAEQKNVEQELRISYLEGRQQNDTNSFVELYLNDSNYPNNETTTSKDLEIMDDSDFNNNWKYRAAGKPDFKNGFLRPQKQPFMLEVIDEYNLNGVAQALVGSISRYDTYNECYWMMSCAAANGIGEITRISKDMKDGRVQVLGRWFLAAKGAATYWTGIDVKTDGTYLFVSLLGNPPTTASWIGKIKVTNSSGVITLGESACPNGGIIYADIVVSTTVNGTTTLVVASTSGIRRGMLISGTGTSAGTYVYSVDSATNITASATVSGAGAVNLTYSDAEARHTENTANNIITDVTVWDDAGTDIGFIQTTAAAGAARAFQITFKSQSGDASWPSVLSASSLTNITMQPNLINGNEALGRSLIKDVSSNTLWTKLSCATAALGRYIWKIDLANDVKSNVLVKTSGRFECARSVADTGNGGVTISAFGDILELCSTASNGKFFAKRALKNALWAENQINFEYRMNASTNPNTPVACMVHNNYIYTADIAASAQAVDLYRFDILTGAKHSVRLSGATRLWTACFDMATDGTNIYLVGWDSTNYEVVFGSLSSLNTALELVSDYSDVNTISIEDAGGVFTLATGIGSANTKALYGICYDSDAGVMLLLNDTDDKIDTLSLDGATWTTRVYDLPAPTSTWSGIAYKNGKIFVGDYTNTTTPGRIFVLDKTLTTATAWYRMHIYQDPSPTFAASGRRCFDFYGNNIISTNQTNLIFYGLKTIEDNDVLQLHTFIDINNIALSSNITCHTGVVERYFEPYDFTDARNVPDKFYCALGYGDEGVTVLHLDEYLNDTTVSGKDRYDIRKIRVWNFSRGASNLIKGATFACSALYIEKDMIFVGQSVAAQTNTIIDLKNGRAYDINTGQYYDGTLSERNGGKGYVGATNTELALSNVIVRKIQAQTFTKSDQSDYTQENPKTFVTIGTDGGNDILVIDWDSNNNRTPVKVWNNVINDASCGQFACWIAPSGTLFLTYNVIPTGPTAKLTIPIWELNAEGATSAALFSAIGTNLLASAGYDISPNSRCWKTPSGTWRHQLVITSADLTDYTFTIKTAIIDVENATIEVIFANGSSTTPTGTMMADVFEDIVFSHHVYSTTRAEMNVFKKLRFNDLKSVHTLNNWTTLKTNGVIDLNSRPNFIPILAVTALLLTCTKYSKNFNILGLSGTSFGLQLFHFPNINQCILESKEMELSQNPSQIVYKSNTITPYSGIEGE